MIKRHATAEWKGNLQQGSGDLTTQSKVLNSTAYTFASRFADGTSTNPEELVAAALSGCFSMALAAKLANAGFTADSVKTQATATFEKLESGWVTTGIHLVTRARVPGVEAGMFASLAEDTRTTCIIARLLKTNITLDAALEG